MKGTLETLRNALLIMAMLWLIYVLYKRLLHVIGRSNLATQYPALDHKLVQTPERINTLMLEMSKAQSITIDVMNENGSEALAKIEVPTEPGANNIPIDMSSLAKGRYFYRITLPNQQVSQYFEL